MEGRTFLGSIRETKMKRYQYNPIELSRIEKSNVPMAVYQLLDNRVATIALSQGFLDLLGYTDRQAAYQLMEQNMYQDIHPDDIARIANETKRFSETGDRFNVVYRSLKDGEWHVIHAFGKHFYPENGIRLAEVWYADEGVFSPGNDLIHEDLIAKGFSISLHEESLNRRSDYDYLTGLPNMTFFYELAANARNRCVAEKKECVLCFADLNGMKYYNKKFGFAQGDKLLCSFGKLLAKYFGNELSCRIAQDSFAFFSEADGLPGKLESLFLEFDVMNAKKGTTVRVGIYSSSMEVVDTSLACDRARYACNSIVDRNESSFTWFDESMLNYETSRQYVLDNLDRALEENWIQAYYQPIVRTASGHVCDEEALARWIDPVKGILSPAEFIPILEDARLIYKVDLHMVEQILKKMKDQEMAGLYVVPISVNLSRTDFDSCDIVSEIRERVDASGISRELLTIEITESVMGRDFDFMKEQVERFQKLGFHVWMDDFGSGYSSLDLLQSLHFDLIKLDMRFMQQFNNDMKSRVIITELIKMAIGLGIDTVCEGVERPDQVGFLSEVGCTKLQGYYFCKPIPLEGIIERNQRGIQIGFENPEEKDYFSSVGRINLYDASYAVKEEIGKAETYFDTLPMAIIGVKEMTFTILRCNSSYRDFMKKSFGDLILGGPLVLPDSIDVPGYVFKKALLQCAKDENKQFIDEKIDQETTVHALVRRIAINPVTDMVACSVVVLGLIKDRQGVTYADIANSLSSDYVYLYYVNTETETFVEYSPNPKKADLVEERHGTDFFASSRRDAISLIHRDDQERFVRAFRKDIVEKAIREHGSFTFTYRLLTNNTYIYVHMKAVRMSSDPKHIIIGVSNIDAQVRAEEALERMREEKITYDRITALSGDFICIYTVDPEKNTFTEYGATGGYEELGLQKMGEDFFGTSLRECSKLVYPEDLPHFREMFSRERVMEEIEKNGVYLLNYRLIIGGHPTYVALKAAKIMEKDGPQLIMGVVNVDAQVRRDMEYNRMVTKEMKGDQ